MNHYIWVLAVPLILAILAFAAEIIVVRRITSIRVLEKMADRSYKIKSYEPDSVHMSVVLVVGAMFVVALLYIGLDRNAGKERFETEAAAARKHELRMKYGDVDSMTIKFETLKELL